MVIRKYLLIIVYIVSFNLSFVIASSLAFAKERQTLKWAADTESGAPFVFPDSRNPNKLIGFEAEIIEAIGKELNFDLEFVQNQWDFLIPGMQRGDYDVAINGIEITPDRKEVVNFSIPYYITFEQLIVNANDESNYHTLADLDGKKVGTLSGSLAERILRGAPGIIVRTYDSEAMSFSDLEVNRLDAVLIDQPVALYYASWNKNLKIIDVPFGEVVYGIVIKDDEKLLKDINHALSKLIATGKLRKIYDDWNLWNDVMAAHFNDREKSNAKPYRFEDYIREKGVESSFTDIIKKYWSYAPRLGTAAVITLQLSILSMVLAIVFGLFLALVKVYAPNPFSTMASLFIELIRGTPLLIQLFFIYYALPHIPYIGIKLDPFLAAIVSLGINYAAYEAENYRAGLYSVSRGQLEAAISLGMTKFQALKYIIIPQALRMVIPPITNDFISLIKDSSLVSVIAMVELTKEYDRIASESLDYIGIGIIVAIIYLLLGLPFVKLSKYVEKKFSLIKNGK